MSASQSTRIVVGVDGSPSSIQALKWALGQAILTGERDRRRVRLALSQQLRFPPPG